MQSVRAISSPIAFRQVTLADQQLFEESVFGTECRNCDMSFANIFCWQEIYHSRIALWEGFLLVRFNAEDGSTAYMQPIGTGSVSDVLSALATDAASLGEPLRIVGLNEEWCGYVRDFFGDGVALCNMAANADYIYLTSDLAELPGRKYQPKRNFINRFTSKYNYRFTAITADNLDHCRTLNNIWCSQKGSKSSDPEQLAVNSALENFEQLPLEGWILYVEDVPCAFSIGSAVNQDTFCIHIEKCDTRFEGVGTMINNLVAIELQHRFKYINREDDLGIEGLRRAKQSYHPHHLLAKQSARQLNQHEADMVALWHEVFGDDLQSIEEFFVRIYNPSRCFTQIIDNRVVAMLHIIPIEQNGVLSAYIYAVATAPQFRHRGIAHTLIEQAIESIRKVGIYDRIILIPASKEAENLYSEFGFEMTDEYFDQSESGIDYDLGSGNNSQDFVMVRKIY